MELQGLHTGGLLMKKRKKPSSLLPSSNMPIRPDASTAEKRIPPRPLLTASLHTVETFEARRHTKSSLKSKPVQET